MLKNATYQQKFSMLNRWIPDIIESIKKDLKNEHLKKDWGFVKQYFPGKNPSKLTHEELAEAYSHAIANSENAEELAEFIVNRWLLKHSDLYYYFEQELGKINPNFNEIEELDRQQSLDMMERAIGEFGAPRTYLFCVLNSVVFPKDVYEELNSRAEKSVKEAVQQAAVAKEQQSVADMQRNYEQQIARLTDKYEKKLQGLQKKYVADVDSLKKQVSTLQRKLAHGK